MSNISITFSIWHVCFLFLALLAGVLAGCFITLCIFKWAFANKESFKGKKNGRKLRRERQKEKRKVSEHVEKVDNDDYDEPDNGAIEDEQNDNEPVSEEPEATEGYQEGSVLKAKLNRKDVLNLFDLGASADGVSVKDKLKAKQSKEDASYSILKSSKKGKA